MTDSAGTNQDILSIWSEVGDQEVVVVFGTFNVLHPGHVRLLRFAKECGDYLVVGVFSDHLAVNAQVDQSTRVESVKSLSSVDYACLIDAPPEQFIARLRPAIVVKGKEYENAHNPEQSIIDSYGGRLVFGSGDTVFSAAEMYDREVERSNDSVSIKPTDYLARHGIDYANLRHILQRMCSLKVCVIGDLIVDEYIQCDPVGMSQEDPTIVVTPMVTKRFLGGAGIVAAHARAAGALEVGLVSLTGNDSVSDFAAEKLKEYGVKSYVVEDESRPTTLKQRFRANGKTLLRVNHLRKHKPSKAVQRTILDNTLKFLKQTDLLIFSDFNYGVLPQELVNNISEECDRLGIMVVADSQSSSQVGNIARFHNAALLTPTEREARLALSNFDDGLVVLAESLRRRTNAANLAITLGGEGLLIHSGDSHKQAWLTDKLPALNSKPRDVAGAGDCLLVWAAMALASDGCIWSSLYLGSIAAACQINRLGNVPLLAEELLMELEKNMVL